ncbi:MAG: threonine aldolase [Myxococcota bacterium]|jgi:threonine aldolase
MTTTLRQRCTHFLHGHGPDTQSPAKVLAMLAEEAGDAQADFYGKGALIASFEAELATLLGKESALFLPSGTLAQPIALRIWADDRGRDTIALHATSHLELHEHRGYQRLYGLHGVPLANAVTPLTPADIEAVADPLAAVLLELPQRELGGVLPTWAELTEMAEIARNRGAAMHLDGARLWESAPFYARSHAEICALFDSVYVSFYKGLGGIAGAALAGPAGFIKQARIWQRRAGGNLISLYPYILSARHGLRTRLPRMADYCCHARDIAAALSTIEGIGVTPSPPHTNMFQLHLRGEAKALTAATHAVAEETGVWLLGSLREAATPGVVWTEVSIGDAGLALSAERVAMLMRRVVAR